MMHGHVMFSVKPQTSHTWSDTGPDIALRVQNTMCSTDVDEGLSWGASTKEGKTQAASQLFQETSACLASDVFF